LEFEIRPKAIESGGGRRQLQITGRREGRATRHLEDFPGLGIRPPEPDNLDPDGCLCEQFVRENGIDITGQIRPAQGGQQCDEQKSEKYQLFHP
jgi:hypothetical protein